MSLKAFCASVMLLLVGAPWASAANRALIVGVGKYRMAGNDLPGIDLDVAHMSEVAKLLGFKDGEIKTLLDSAATHDSITQAFQTWLVQGVAPQDKVLFYFSGHGSYVKDDNGDEPDGTDEVILPTDTQVAGGSLKNALVDDELGTLLDGLPTRNVYVFLDSCHSGTATRSLGGDYVSKFFTYPGMPTPKQAVGAARGLDSKKGAASETHVVITAATEREQAQAGKQGSLFTIALLATVEYAVKEHVALTPVDLRNSTNEIITEILNRAERPALIHHPTVYGDAALLGKDLLASSASVTTAAAGTPAPPPAAARPAPAPAPTAAPATPAPAAVQAPAPAPPTTQAQAPPATQAAAPPPTQAPAARPQQPVTRPPAAQAPAPAVTSSAAAAAPGPVWSQLSSVAKGAAYTVKLAPNKSAYQVGEELVLEVDVASDGYLNVLNVGAGDSAAIVLYPNKYHPDNAVKAGQKVTIPGRGAGYSIPADLPAGQSEQQQLLLVLHTKQKLSAYEAGAGDGFLRALSGPATRSFSVVASKPESGGYGVGQAVVVIRK
jgi:hypothetical protein